MRFLAIGECMAELAPSDVAGDFRLGFAGDTFNTAWYLAKVAPEVSVSYLTVVGQDKISDQLVTFMSDSGIKTEAVARDPKRTLGLYMISLIEGERSFSYWRGQSAARTLADDKGRLATAMSAADVIYFSGITLAILEPGPRNVLLTALANARAQGKTVAFDPNLRVNLWAAPEEMTKAIMQAAAVSDVILPSFEDEAAWFQDATPEATADRYLSAGAVTVIVKNGSDAVFFKEGGSTGEVPVAALTSVTDTTAAGDSFNAGLFAGHASRLSLRDGVAYGCALSRVVVQHKGALVNADLPLLPVNVG